MEIIIQNVSKSIDGEDILQDVSLEIGRGETFALIGPNGAGKTTLVRIILGLYKATRGEVFVDGVNVKDKDYERVKQKIGFLLDNIGLFKDLTAWENMEFFDRIYFPSDSFQKRNERITRLLKMVDLYPKRDNNITFFSRGMKQRLALARAMINDPLLLILDEPSRGLDLEGQLMLREYITEIKSNGSTIFINSHDLKEIQKISTKIAIIQNGRILDNGSYEYLKDRFCENTYSISAKTLDTWVASLKKCDFVNWMTQDSDAVVVNLKKDCNILPDWLNKNGVKITELKKVNNDLENIYSKIIKYEEKFGE